VDRGKIILKRTTIDEKDVGRSLSLALTSSKMPHPACGLRMPTPNISGWLRCHKLGRIGETSGLRRSDGEALPGLIVVGAELTLYAASIG
jgi:hypothetical protein